MPESGEFGAKELWEYKHGENVTKENFVSFLIQSFAVSKGFEEVQYFYFKWVEAQQKTDNGTKPFDLLYALQKKASPWDSLSVDERNAFENAFDSVKSPKHQTMVVTSSQFNYQLHKICEQFKSNDKNNLDQISDEELRNFLNSTDLATVSFTDMSSVAAPALVRLREKLKNRG